MPYFHPLTPHIFYTSISWTASKPINFLLLPLYSYNWASFILNFKGISHNNRGCSKKNFDKDIILPVILKPAKNLIFSLFLKSEDPLVLGFKMTRKGKLTRILEHFSYYFSLSYLFTLKSLKPFTKH